MSNFRYFSSQLLQEAQVFIQLFILPNFRCLSSQFPQEAPVPPASDIYAEVSHKKWGGGGILEIGSTPNIAFGRQKYIFDKLLDNFASKNIHQQISKGCCSRTNKIVKRYFGLQAKILITKCYWQTKNIFVIKYSGLQSKIYLWQNILVCRQKTGQANWSRVRLGLAKYW